VVDADVAQRAIDSVQQWRASRNEDQAQAALNALRDAAATSANLMPFTIGCVRAGVTTGEWADALRSIFGEFRAPTGVSGVGVAGESPGLDQVRDEVRRTEDELGSRLRFLVAKPGLDGHSNGAEQIAVRARDAGFEVIYQGIRLTPEQIISAAVEEDVAVVGISILSGAHGELVPRIVQGIRDAGLTDTVVVVGGIIPPDDAQALLDQGVADVFTPKDYDATQIMSRIIARVRAARGLG